jgi:hypothetical protein
MKVMLAALHVSAYGHETDMAGLFGDVRSRGQNGSQTSRASAPLRTADHHEFSFMRLPDACSTSKCHEKAVSWRVTLR